MRLMTHNFLQSNVRGTTKGYPLKIEASRVVVEQSPLDRQLITKLLPKIDYAVLFGAVQQLNNASVELPQLPEACPEEWTDEQVEALHTILMDVHVLEGQLVCPDTSRNFPIKEGIPNMILHEDEV